MSEPKSYTENLIDELQGQLDLDYKNLERYVETCDKYRETIKESERVIQLLKDSLKV